MKAFRFRLETSLNIAERQEQMAREELLARMAKRDAILEQLNLAWGQLHSLEQNIRDSMSARIPLENILIIKDYIPVVREMIANLGADLRQAEQELEEARSQLLEKVKETRTLQKLKQKEWRLYLLEWNREEQKLIDEIAITGHFRKTPDR